MSEQERAVKEAELEKLKEELKDVKGTPTECYSRVVGYLRPVQSWNKGKQEEFSLRKKFKCSCK